MVDVFSTDDETGIRLGGIGYSPLIPTRPDIGYPQLLVTLRVVCLSEPDTPPLDRTFWIDRNDTRRLRHRAFPHASLPRG
jgi:hypothetical protein